METSNIHKICCMYKKNCELKKIIDRQNLKIGMLIEEKNQLEDQYQNLLNSIDINSLILVSSNIELEEVDSNLEIDETTSNILL